MRHSFLQISYHELDVVKLVGKVLHDSHKLVMHPKINNAPLRTSTSATLPQLTP